MEINRSNDVNFAVSELRGLEGEGPLDSTDIYLTGRGISLLVNIPAGPHPRVTYSFRVDGHVRERGSIPPESK